MENVKNVKLVNSVLSKDVCEKLGIDRPDSVFKDSLKNSADVPLDRQIFKHEYHHTLEEAQGYDKYTKRVENSKVFKSWISARAKELGAQGTYNNQYAAVLNEYIRKQKSVTDLTNTKAKNEAFADFMAEELFGGKDFDKTMGELEKAFEDKSAFRKFIDAIKNVLSSIKEALGGSASAEALERNIVKLQKQIDSGKTVKENSGVRFKNSVDNTNKTNYNKNEKEFSYERTDEFRELQAESKRIYDKDIESFHNGSKQCDERIRGRLSRIFERQIKSASSSNGNVSTSIVNPKTGKNISIYENVDYNLFHDVFEIAQKYLFSGDAVDVHEATEYKNCKNYLTSNGLGGFSITADGDLISVYNLGEKGFLKSISNFVRAKGAKTLDCFNSTKQCLPDIYSYTLGFKNAATLDFNYEILAETKGKEYADYFVKNYGEAPVCFMVNTEKDVETKHFNKDQYDEAVDYRNSFVENDIKFSVAGKNAQTADKLKLSTAKQMEKDGADSETIRKETGWFRGYDKKWRFEIDDSMIKIDKSGRNSKNPEVRRYYELFDKAYVECNATANEMKELSQLDEKFADKSLVPNTLGELLQHNELFKAYPQLKDIGITFYEFKNGTKGFFNPVLDQIVLDKHFVGEQLKGTLLHEIQHAIQAIEGFSNGASIDYWNKKVASYKDEYQSAQKEYEKRLDGFIDVLYRYGFTDEDFEDIDFTDKKGILKAKKGLEKLDAPNGAIELSDSLIKYLDDRNNAFDEYVKVSKRSASDLYEATAGEIEARDVSNRRNLTAEQRKNTRPDIDRTDVVFSDIKNDTKYSIDNTKQSARDTDYMSAVENGDTKTAQEMVEQSAMKWGAYSKDGKTPLELYHGTKSFGFTEFDLNRMDDKRSIFLTSSKEIASTYSGTEQVRNIVEKSDVDKMSNEELVELLNQQENSLVKYSYKYMSESKINSFKNKFEKDIKYYSNFISDEINQIENALKGEEWADKNKILKAWEDGTLQKMSAAELSHFLEIESSIKIIDILKKFKIALKNKDYKNIFKFTNDYKEYNSIYGEYNDKLNQFVNQFVKEDIPINRELDKVGENECILKNLDDNFFEALSIKEAKGQLEILGNYSLYAKLDNPLVVECNGRNWNDINHKAVKSVEDYSIEEKSKDKWVIIDKFTGERVIMYPNVAWTKKEYAVEALEQYVENNKENPAIYDTTREVAEYAQKHGYDGVIFKDLTDNGGRNVNVSLDTEADIYIVFDPNAVKSADAITYDDDGNVIPLSKRFDESDSDIRFSLSDEVEETKDLVAVHNVKENKLLEALNLGGLPSPSIAVMRNNLGGNSDFGDISLVFYSDTIDPETNSKNNVYSSDAYTPIGVKTEYKLNSKLAMDLYSKMNELTKGSYVYKLNPADFHPDNLRNAVNSKGGSKALIEQYKNDYGMKQAFLADTAEPVKEVVKKKEKTTVSNDDKAVFDYLKDNIKSTLDEIDKTELINPKVWREKYDGKVKQAIENYYKELIPGISEDGIENIFNNSEFKATFQRKAFVRRALKYYKNGDTEVKSVEDNSATKKLIDDKVNQKKYEKWLNNLFDKVVEKKGIYNGEDFYTDNGDEKSFEETHWDYTLDNIVRAMNQQDAQGGNFLVKNIFGGSATKYNSLDEIRNDKQRLKTVNQEELETEKSRLNDKFLKISQDMTKGTNADLFAVTDTIVDGISKSKTKDEFRQYLKKELSGWAHYDEKAFNQLCDLVKEIRQLPTEYFEAKPQRAVGFDEVAYAVIPDNSSDELKTRLEENGVKYIEYKNGDEQSRIDALNDDNSVKFSVDDEDIDRYTEKQYNNFGWVRANDVLTSSEYQHFNNSFSDNKNLKFKFTKNPTTKETIIPTGDNANLLNVLVYTKGTFKNPIITKVVRINSNDTTDVAMIRSDILECETRGYKEPYGFIENYYGKVFLEFKRESLPSLQEFKRQRKGKIGAEINSDSGKINNGTESIETNRTDSKAGLNNNSAFSIDDEQKKYSYDELTSKPDMKITTLSEVSDAEYEKYQQNTSLFAKDMVKIARKANNLKNTKTATYLHNDDTNSDIMIAKDSFKHGASRFDKSYVDVSKNLSSILKNAIAVNELKPRENSNGTKVFIGMTEYNDNYVFVRMVVDNRTQNLNDYDILYAIKKEDVSPRLPDYPASRGSVTSSTISISDLLENVKNVKLVNSVLSKDVCEKLGIDRPDSVFKDSLKYSLRDNEVLDREQINSLQPSA